MADSYYALEKFKELKMNLDNISETMPIKRKAVRIYTQKNQINRAKDTFSELEAIKENLSEVIKELRLLFSECDMQKGAEYANRLYGAVIKFNLMTEDYTKFIEAIDVLKNEIPITEAVTGKVIGHLMNNVKLGYYPTDIDHIKMIKQALVFPDCKVNLFDPCCGEGYALEKLALNENADTYGIELDGIRRTKAEERIKRVGFGSFFASRVSYECFHAILLNPPYLSLMGENGIKSRSEKRFLVESMYNLMLGGVMMYIIPYYRLTMDICKILCNNFENISVYRFLDSEFSKFKQVVVFGIKKERSENIADAEKLSQYAMMPEKIPMIDTITPESYVLPSTEKTVETFKGEEFNLGELKRQLAASNSINMLFEKSKLDAMEKRPLLPLNIGQLGLIGGSGLINGYVDCDSPHVIKGRIIKEVRTRENEEMNTLTETRVNKMIFNILTPNGVKKLA